MTSIQSQEKLIQQFGVLRERLFNQIHRSVIGEDDVIELMLIALFSRGHCLLVGVPGLAKTLLVQTISKVLKLNFSRIQFTPDLMPSDITGTEIIEDDHTTGKRVFRFIKGPVFSNIILADEINRTPPKTQSALLQAMQEYQVTAGGQTYSLDPPFFVLATQNPIEQEGTYPLPEAQLDRFMFHIKIDYPQKDQEVEIVRSTTSQQLDEPEPVLSGSEVSKIQETLRRVPVSRHVLNYAVELVRATRPGSGNCPSFVDEWVTWGAGPRGGQNLILGAKARAILNGRFNVSCEDIRQIAPSVLRHRMFTNFNAEAEGIDTDTIIGKIIDTVAEPKG